MSQRTLSKKLSSHKPGTLYVGVDLALDHNVAVVLTERAQQLTRFRFPNERDGYDYFYRRLATLQQGHQAPAVLVGLEPTNYYWKLLATDMEQHQPDYRYRLVNPYTVKKNREGDHLDQSKDDNRDAFTIADLVRTGKYTETRLLQAGYAELRQYVTLHTRLQKDLRRQKMLINNLAGQLFPELRQVFEDFTGLTAVAMLRHHAAAVAVKTLSEEAFIAGVRADFEGRRLMVSKLRWAHHLAQQSVGLQAGSKALQLALRLHIDTWQALQQQLVTADTALAETFLALPEAPYLLSIPAMSIVSAATILAEIGDPSHYTNGRQLIKLAGIQPVPNTSGRKTRSQTPMSHKGRPRLRTALFFAVMRLVRLDRAFAQVYQQLQQRAKNPLTPMQALGALMNKLLRIVWALIRQATFYQPDLPAVA